MRSDSRPELQIDASELLLGRDQRFFCETYIFEPSPVEITLGRLMAVAEVESFEGVEKELLDMAIAAMQREYYRDASRGIISSFESALHQANLVLHDSAQQGVRDWMRHFHVAVAVLAGQQLHISVAGKAVVILRRHMRLTTISEGLSHSPISDPLRTFSQVASGTVNVHDVIFLGTVNFPALFHHAHIVRFPIDQAAATINARLKKLYHTLEPALSMAILTLIIQPQDLRQISTPAGGAARQPLSTVNVPPAPRKPLLIHRSRWQTFSLVAQQLFRMAWHMTKTHVWPALRWSGSMARGLFSRASVATGRSASSFAREQLSRWKRRPEVAELSVPVTQESSGQSAVYGSTLRERLLALRQHIPLDRHFHQRLWNNVRGAWAGWPVTSKILFGMTIVLTFSLIFSVSFLYRKRVEDTKVQQASELLHEARTKQQAAASAMIYDNREQAQTLLAESEELLHQLEATGLYAQEAGELRRVLTADRDRTQRIWRVPGDQAMVVGDFASALGGAEPTHLFFVDGSLYTYHPTTNAIVQMDVSGAVSVASSQTQGIGFFSGGVAHDADKNITLITDEPGIALFDAKTKKLITQTITLPSANPDITSLAVYGNRLYVYDAAADTIYSYAKSLRGYGGGEVWLTDQDFPRDTIRSLSIDGSVYTLHTDGEVRKLFKGEQIEFSVEALQPPLRQPNSIITSPEFTYLYVVDAASQRVVVFTKQGQLDRQIYLESSTPLRDIAIASDETTLFALRGSQVVRVPLATP